jgi:NAD(P)-dependent dehydrogenase (short-subunit alcohol dehydrogenase family)
MAKIFITGSTDGLGMLAAKSLVSLGHEVLLHARNPERGIQALTKPGATQFVTADLTSMSDTITLAKKVNDCGAFDVIIHNAGVYEAGSQQIAAVNTFAPYILTSLINKPKRLIYLSSGLHLSGKPNLEHLHVTDSKISYADSKLHVLMLAFAVARMWPDIFSNAVNPGWVPTKMGGAGAPDDLEKGFKTQVWLADSDDVQAKVSGRYFFHQQERATNPFAQQEKLQEQFMARCAAITNIRMPVT